MPNVASSNQMLETLFVEHNGFLTRQQVVDAGLRPRTLSRLIGEGRVERVQRGVYRLSDAPMQTAEELLELHLRVPHAVVCLTSALAYHRLSTVAPLEVHLAISRTARTPAVTFPPVHFYRFSTDALEYGVTSTRIGGVDVPIFTPEKTLADLLKYRNKLGIDLFLEGLKTYFSKTPRPDLHALREAARVCRVEDRMGTYLQLMAVNTET
jgi:predicted transcriptional regulator of viral defense system